MNQKNIRHNEQGMIAIVMVMIVATVALAIISTLTVMSISNLKMSNSPGAFDQTYYAAEAGLNEALYRVISDPVPGSYSFTFAGAVIQVTVSSDPLDPYRRYVESRAVDSSGRVRSLRVIASTDSYSGGFNSAVNSGSGGITMKNGSCVVGNIYSRGPISGPGAGDNGCKTAGATECRPAYPYKDSIIQKDANHDGRVTLSGASTVSGISNTGDIVAHSISQSTAGKYAKYQALSGVVKANGGSENCNLVSGTYCIANNPDEPEEEMPIKTADIDKWKSEIVDAAPVAFDDCPADPVKYCISNNNRTLGLKKINEDLYVGNGKTLTLTGNLWITGNIILDNNGTIRLDPSLGGLSVVIIADGIVDVNNNYTLEGSGDSRSFMLIISTIGVRTGDCSDHDLTKRPAICASNNSNSIIFSAPSGTLHVKNGGCLNAAATYETYLEPNSTVNFNPMLSAFTIPGAGGTEVGTVLGSWKEL